MADTRCANPEYQLEVDTMSLEYLIYQCIKAQMDEFKAGLGEGNNAGAELHETSTRLLRISDSAFNETSKVKSRLTLIQRSCSSLGPITAAIPFPSS